MDYPTPAAALRGADFERVKIVGLKKPSLGFDSPFGHLFKIAWSRTLDAAQRRRLRELIEALPAGPPARCHMPRMGLRFGAWYREVRVSLCFRCSNAYVAGELAAFSGGSEQAHQLLTFLRDQAPTGWKSSE